MFGSPILAIFSSPGGFKNNRAPEVVVVCDDGAKRQKSFSSRKPLENKAAGTSVGKEKVSSSSAKEKSVESIQGKTRFYHESIRLSQDMVEGQLLGFGRLILALKPGD